MSFSHFPGGAELCGYLSGNSCCCVEDLEFPIEAYAAFLQAHGLPLPKAWQRLNLEPHAQGAEAPDEAGNPEMVEPEAPSVAPDDSYEVVPGITIGELRALLDEEFKGTRFRPLLLATIRAAIEIDRMRAQVPQNGSFTMTHGCKADEVLEKKLSELGCWDPTVHQERVNGADMRCVTRMLRLTHMAKNGRTKTD